MNTETPQIQEVYQTARTAEHRHAQETLVTPLLRKHGLALHLSRVLDHPSDTRRLPVMHRRSRAGDECGERPERLFIISAKGEGAALLVKLLVVQQP